MNLERGVVVGLLFPALGMAGPAQSVSSNPNPSLAYCIVDTGQYTCFSDQQQLLVAPAVGKPFFGQDCFYQGAQPSYRDNGDGTISDLNTGLIWQKTPDLDNPVTFREAVAGAPKFKLAGHADWRLPGIKELYSLIDFKGNMRSCPPVAFIDSKTFDFRYGDESRGERFIDAQYWSSTEYVGQTMRGDATVFGVNFADGRIKGYPRDLGPGGRTARHFVRYVRGNPDYGKNHFVDNRDGTISDLATGLMWTQADSGKTEMNWEQALAYCEELNLAGHHDWRLPNAKELQSIVDYTRAPDALESSRRGPAIDPVFHTTDPEAWFWTSTTHLDGHPLGARAVYIAFGRATGLMPDPRTGQRRMLNVHGAGAQRSDPKSGDPKSPMWAHGFGPQGDEIRILNYARAARNIVPGSICIVKPDTTPIPVPPPPPPPAGPEERRGPRGFP